MNTELEQGLLEVRHGITDFSSIVFVDEGGILAGRRTQIYFITSSSGHIKIG